ncbi:hypothetical protein MT418_004451 [Batrachochytrium dendrobatidis]
MMTIMTMMTFNGPVYDDPKMVPRQSQNGPKDTPNNNNNSLVYDDPKGEQSDALRILLLNDRKSRHRRIKKQRRYERLAATSQLSLW